MKEQNSRLENQGVCPNYLTTYIENFTAYSEAHVRPKTQEKFLTVIRSFQSFGSRFQGINKLSKVTTSFLESYKLYRAKKASKGTANHDLKVLSIMFNWAVAQNLIKYNPAKEVKRFKVDSKQPRFFSQKEIKLILSECPRRWYPAYLILLHTGMRRGELTNLEWKDIDFERKIIKIAPKDGWAPKGKREREIPINDELHDLLLKLRTESRRREVLEKNNPKRYDTSLWESLRRLTKRLGIENASIHTFRHTFASYLIMNGVDIVTVKELLGHADITTTMRYAHLVPGHKHWAVNRICSVFPVDTIWSQSEKLVM